MNTAALIDSVCNFAGSSLKSSDRFGAVASNGVGEASIETRANSFRAMRNAERVVHLARLVLKTFHMQWTGHCYNSGPGLCQDAEWMAQVG